jgi:hypothetical protein
MFSFDDANWQMFGIERTKKLGVWPNQLWHNDEESLGTLVIFKPKAYDEYPVSQTGLNHVLTALQAQRIVRGQVVFACGVLWKPELVAAKDVAAVAAMLQGVPPRDGPYGPYWWLRADFTLDGRVLSDDTTPF